MCEPIGGSPQNFARDVFLFALCGTIGLMIPQACGRLRRMVLGPRPHPVISRNIDGKLSSSGGPGASLHSLPPWDWGGERWRLASYSD
jgi:hypothetical protein